jgi:hypothetical protein
MLFQPVYMEVCMSMELVLAGLVIWIAVGLGTAFIFGTFTRRSDRPDDADELAPPTVKHLRPRKRTVQIGVRPDAKAADKIKVNGSDTHRVVSNAS